MWADNAVFPEDAFKIQPRLVVGEFVVRKFDERQTFGLVRFHALNLP